MRLYIARSAGHYLMATTIALADDKDQAITIIDDELASNSLKPLTATDIEEMEIIPVLYPYVNCVENGDY